MGWGTYSSRVSTLRVSRRIEEKGNVGLGNRDTALGAGCCCESLKAEDCGGMRLWRNGFGRKGDGGGCRVGFLGLGR